MDRIICKMCGPALLIASMAITAAGGAYSYMSSKKIAGYQQAVLNRNAKDAENRGAVAEQEHRLKVQQFKGKQRVAYGASGVEIDSGSPVDILLDTAETGEIDALTIRHNAGREAQGLRDQGVLAKAQGDAKAYSSLISSAGQVSSQWYQGKKDGTL